MISAKDGSTTDHIWEEPNGPGVQGLWVLQPARAAPGASAFFQEVSTRFAEPSGAASHARDRGVPAALVCGQR